MALSPLSSVRSLPTAPRRVPAPAAPVVGKQARAREEAWDRPDFTSIDGFKNYVVKWVGYVRDARAGLENAQNGLAEAKRAMAAADEQYNLPVRAAQDALNKVQAEYQAPVDRLTRELNAARNALDLSLHPGLERARQLDAQAADLARQIDGCESRIASLRASINNLDPRSSSYRWQADSMSDEIARIQRDEAELSRRRFALMAEANDQRAINASYNAPEVVAARDKVKQTTDALEAAQAALRNQTAPFRDAVDAATRTYNGQMAASRANVGDAQRKVDAAQTTLTEASNRLAHLDKEVGFFRKLWWNLAYHFDAGKFFGEQSKLALG